MTENYIDGMRAIAAEQLPMAREILAVEPADSPCYGLALANKALVELRLEDYAAAEITGRLALVQFDGSGCPHPPTWVQTLRNLGESISLQDRLGESLPVFRDGCAKARELVTNAPDFEEDLSLEEAHTYNSWGGALLKSRQPNDAVVCFTAGRDIYRRYPDNVVGCAETLTNLAQAYTELGRRTEASLAIHEATELASDDQEQLYRVRIAGARLGLYSNEEARRILLEAAADAERGGFFETAYIRHCIAAYLANEANDVGWGLEVVRLAEALDLL